MLSPAHLATLRALLDRIIPPDEDPGAWEAGVGDYLLRQFDGDLRAEVDHYRAGLEALEAEALAAAGSPFSTLSPDQQDAVLRRVEAGDVVHAWPVDPAQFFALAVQHAIEGYYSDPGNGGNRDGAAWRMIDFVPRRLEDDPA
jgi:hypothetical protein